MKKNLFILFGIISFLLVSCASFKSTDSSQYEKVSFKERYEWFEGEYSYPQFKNDRYQEVNLITRAYIEHEYKAFKKDAEKMKGSYKTNILTSMPAACAIAVTDIYEAPNGILNLLIIKWAYHTGNVHGDYQFKSINYDMKRQQLLTAQQASRMTTKEISKAVQDVLKKEGRLNPQSKTGTTPDNINLDAFIVDGNQMTIHFGPYEIGSYADGPQSVTIDLND